MSKIQSVAVVGAGTMGHGIAHVFAQHGRDVTLIDVSESRLEEARETIARNLERQVRREVLSAEAAEETLARLATATGLDAAADAEIVVEAVPEKAELKAEIFRQLDELAPDEAILASNTSSISITTPARETRRPEQVIGMHRLLSMAHMNSGDAPGAKLAILNLLRAVPDYEPDPVQDPPSYTVLVSVIQDQLRQQPGERGRDQASQRTSWAKKPGTWIAIGGGLLVVGITAFLTGDDGPTN